MIVKFLPGGAADQIARAISVPLQEVLVFLEVRPSLPVKDVKGFIAYAKANPGKLTYGSPLFPDVPTLNEVGLKNFDADTVFGFYAPCRPPSSVPRRMKTPPALAS